jgi:hypothetical protein
MKIRTKHISEDWRSSITASNMYGRNQIPLAQQDLFSKTFDLDDKTIQNLLEKRKIPFKGSQLTFDMLNKDSKMKIEKVFPEYFLN